MKARRIMILAAVVFFLGTVDVVARTMWGSYNGFDQVRLMVNEEEKKFYGSDVPAVVMDGRTMLPLRAAADALNALITYDDDKQTVHLYHPNVHMFPVKDVSKSSKGEYTMKGPFSIVNQGDTINFTVFTQVDNLKVSISSIKLTIISPSGKTAATPIVSDVSDSSDSFWYPIAVNGFTFSESGVYTLQYVMKMSGSWDYTVVSEKEIESR